ncbi:extracellular solute-binding protein [Micromonospora sp. M12]
MGNGGAGMELMGQWAPAVQASSSTSKKGLGDKLGFFPFPAVEGGKGTMTEVFGGGNGFAIGKDAPAATVDFLKFLLSADNQRKSAATGAVLPTVKDAASGIPDANGKLVAQTLASYTGFQLYLDQAYAPALGSQINDSVAELIAGNKPPAQIVRTSPRWRRPSDHDHPPIRSRQNPCGVGMTRPSTVSDLRRGDTATDPPAPGPGTARQRGRQPGRAAAASSPSSSHQPWCCFCCWSSRPSWWPVTPASTSGTASGCRRTSSGWTTTHGHSRTRPSAATCGAESCWCCCPCSSSCPRHWPWPCCSTSRCGAAPRTD